MSSFDKRGADRLAYEVALLVTSGRIGERSAAADALLDYLQIGWFDGPEDVQAWTDGHLTALAEEPRKDPSIAEQGTADKLREETDRTTRQRGVYLTR